MNEEIIKKIKELRKWCIDFATGRSRPYEEYEKMRSDLLTFYPRVINSLPEWLLDNPSGRSFWNYTKSIGSTYQSRREFFNPEFDRIENHIQLNSSANVELALLPNLKELSNTKILDLWNKCIARKADDPEGVITASRTMIETTLKHILDERSVSYKKEELPAMYKLVAKELKLSPSGNTEQTVKQILSGCISIIDGIAAFRNEYGDAHGKSNSYQAPLKVHSDFILNISGGLSLFLIEMAMTEKNAKLSKSLSQNQQT